MGHGLHQLLTRIGELAVAGINGVEWDAVELPSQFMENFCWEWEQVQAMTAHVSTGAPLPRTLFERMLAANKDLESFSYSVSHDLRSPLRHISSFVSLLQEHLGTQPDEVSARYLSTISGSARHMSQLIDGLLAFSRLGRAAVNLAPVDMGELVQAVVAELSHDTGGRVVDWVIAPDLPQVQGDALLLREVWANLLSNAFKYTRLRERARIEVGWRLDNDAHMFYIKDNGVGFDTKYAKKLFGVFQRLHRATEFEGTGIGLALTKRIVERHAGEVWAESQANVGSTFSFSIPLDSHPRLFAQHEPT